MKLFLNRKEGLDFETYTIDLHLKPGACSKYFFPETNASLSKMKFDASQTW